MKRRITALLTAFLLAMALCVPAMAAKEYGAYYDETEQLGSVELTYQGEQKLPQLTQQLDVDLRVAAFTDEDVSADTSGADEGKPVRKSTLPMYIIVVVVSLVIPGGICLVLKWKIQTVHKKVEANEYVAAGGLRLTKKYDRYTHTTETQRKIHSDSDSGSGRSRKF